MNKASIALILIVALVAIAEAHHGRGKPRYRGHGGHGGHRGHAGRILGHRGYGDLRKYYKFNPFGRRGGLLNHFYNRYGLAAGQRRRQAVRAGVHDNERARIAAKKDKGAKLRLRNRAGAEKYHNENNAEALNINHNLNKSNKLEVHIKKENTHNESKNINYKRGRALNKGQRRYQDTAVDAAKHDREALKASKAREQGAHLSKHAEHEKYLNAHGLGGILG